MEIFRTVRWESKREGRKNRHRWTMVHIQRGQRGVQNGGLSGEDMVVDAACEPDILGDRALGRQAGCQSGEISSVTGQVCEGLCTLGKQRREGPTLIQGSAMSHSGFQAEHKGATFS